MKGKTTIKIEECSHVWIRGKFHGKGLITGIRYFDWTCEKCKVTIKYPE